MILPWHRKLCVDCAWVLLYKTGNAKYCYCRRVAWEVDGSIGLLFRNNKACPAFVSQEKENETKPQS